MECMFLQQQQPHTVACNVPPVNPFEFIGAHRQLLLLACWAGIRKGRPKYYSCCKTHEIFSDRRWRSKDDMLTVLEGRFFELKYLHERCARKSRVFARIPLRLLERLHLKTWAYSDTISGVGRWQTSMERLLGDRRKTRNIWRCTYFLWEDLEIEGEPDAASAVEITRNSPISQQALVFGYVLTGTVAYLSNYCTILKSVTLRPGVYKSVRKE